MGKRRPIRLPFFLINDAPRAFSSASFSQFSENRIAHLESSSAVDLWFALALVYFVDFVDIYAPFEGKISSDLDDYTNRIRLIRIEKEFSLSLPRVSPKRIGLDGATEYRY